VSRRPRRAALLVLAGSLTLAGCAGTDPDTRSDAAPRSASTSAAPTTTAGQRIEVQVAGGQVTGDTGRVSVVLGEQVTLSVTSDAPEEVHVHGYDLEATLTPGTPAELTFDATLAGVFEVELHDAGTVLLTLQVS
jgi:hypothetical protein